MTEVINAAEVTRLVRERIKAEGYTPHPRSKVYNPIAMTALIGNVAAKLEIQGLGGQANVEKAMVNATKHLCAAWRGSEDNSNWIVTKFVASGLGTSDDNDGTSDTQDGPTDGSSSVSGNSDNGTGGGEGGNDTPAPVNGQASQGQYTNEDGHEDGDGTGGIAPSDGEEEDGDDTGGGEGGNDTPMPPQPDPTDLPDTEDYEPPSVWFKIVRIIKWNLAHPGEQKNIMLVGPAGIGKTKLVFEISKKFFHKKPYAITAPQMEFKICGFNDAMGREVKTPVTRGYVDDEGGIILIDEIDRMEANAGIALNMATANKSMDTPNGMIDQAANVTFIATANTSGTGATNDFNTANQLDKSTRDRWIYLLVEWDHKVALKVARGDETLVKGLEDWNNACDKIQYSSGLLSYRTIVDILDLMDMGCFTFEEALEAAMLKYAIPKSNLTMLYDAMPDHFNKVAKAVKKIMEKMPDNDDLY